jgi:glycogen synthase
MMCSEYPPNKGMGGIGTYAATVAGALSRRGHDVRVVTKGDGTVAVEDGVTVRRVRPRRRLTRLKASAIALRSRPHVVQAAEWGAEAWLLARFTRLPIVTRLATPTHVIEELNGLEPTRRSRLFQFLERDQTRRSAAVYAPTRAIIQRVARDWSLSPNRIELVPNPVDIQAIRRAGAASSPVALPDRFMVYVGGLERRKGLDELGQAAAGVLRADPNLHLVCIGYAGPDDVMALFRRNVEPVQDRVHLVGELPRDEALSIVARAELVVLPSHWESFGYTCVEALALGKPMVATDTGGFAEILEDGVTGWLVPPSDAKALEATVTRVLGEPARLRRVAEAAPRRADDFDVDCITDRLVSLFAQARVDKKRRHVTPAIYREGYRRHFDPEGATETFRDLYVAKRQLVLDHFSALGRRRVLDVGGGFGRFAEPLSRGHDVSLCDLSAAMVAEARQRCGAAVRVVQADARHLPLRAETFDSVLAMDLVVHLPDLAEGVRELARVLRPGGELVFDTTNARPWWVLAYPRYWQWRPDRLVRTMLASGVQPAWRHTVRHQSAEEVRRLIAGAGLCVEKVSPLGPSWTPKWHVWWVRKPA